MSHDALSADAAPDPSRLTRWREARKFTQAHLARLLHVSRSRVCEVEAGRGCSLALATRIERLTKGAVRASDLARSAPVRPRRPKPQQSQPNPQHHTEEAA